MKKYFLVLIPLFISTGCFLSYTLIGSKIIGDGILIEPFFLIPIGWFFFLVAIILILVLIIFHYLKKNRL